MAPRPEPKPKRTPPFKALRKFSGPPELLDAALTGTITGSEFMLTCIIDALSINGKQGCYATNKYFAECFDCTPGHVSDMIGRLIKLKFLVSETVKTNQGQPQRYLWTRWTRYDQTVTPEPTNHSEFVSRNGDNHPYPPTDTVRTPPTDTIRTPSIKGIEDEERDEDSDTLIAATAAPGVGGPFRRHSTSSQTTTSNGSNGRPTLKQESTSNPDRVAAGRLHDILKRHRKLPPSQKNKPDMGKWADQIRRLRGGLEGDELDQVLDWMEEHAGDKWTPNVESARSFCDKFRGLQAAMGRTEDKSRDDSSDNNDDVPTVVTTPYGEYVMEKLENWTDWPSHTLRQLPAVVEESLKVYGEFRDRLFAVDIESLKDSGMQWYVQNSQNVLPSERRFVIEWYEDIIRRYGEWPDWSGKVTPVKIPSKAFTEYGEDVTEKGRTSKPRWAMLMKLLGYVKDAPQ